LINDVPDGCGDRRPHRPRTAATPLAALAAALLTAAVAGCGGGGGEGSATGSTGASVRTATTTSQAATSSTTSTAGIRTIKDVKHLSPTTAAKFLLLSPNARFVCSPHAATEHYLRAAYGGRAGCVKAVSPTSAAKSLGPLQVDVTGDKATVTAHPVGGIYDGEKITVSLIRSGSGWKVDAIKSNAPVGP
jgi:hypothetical protein